MSTITYPFNVTFDENGCPVFNCALPFFPPDYYHQFFSLSQFLPIILFAQLYFPASEVDRALSLGVDAGDLVLQTVSSFISPSEGYVLTVVAIFIALMEVLLLFFSHFVSSDNLI